MGITTLNIRIVYLLSHHLLSHHVTKFWFLRLFLMDQKDFLELRVNHIEWHQEAGLGSGF